AAVAAESHIAAFYPPNRLFYRVFDVGFAYRALMWLHLVGLSAATYAYARSLRAEPAGAALAAAAFTFCGFQAIHASHEPFYHVIAYLPFALWRAEVYLERGGAANLAWTAAGLGAACLLGHYQIQMWTFVLVMATGLWRVLRGESRRGRLWGLAAASLWGLALAAAPLVLSAGLAWETGQYARTAEERMYYGYPPSHWFEAAWPLLTRGLRTGAEGGYWDRVATTGYEAAFYVGTVPLIMAFVGFCDRRGGRGAGMWKLITPATLLLATMPYWAPKLHLAITAWPLVGSFRCPSRHTLTASLGLSLLAGRGLDRAVSGRAFWSGWVGSAIWAAASIAGGLAWSRGAGVDLNAGTSGLPPGLVWTLAVWFLGLALTAAWRVRLAPAWTAVVLALGELVTLYYTGPTHWGWAIEVPRASPVLSNLASKPSLGRVAGVLDDLPMRCGIATGSPYLGFRLAPEQTLMMMLAETARAANNPEPRHWLRRYGVSHAVWDRPAAILEAAQESVIELTDPALDAIVKRQSDTAARRVWRLVTLEPPLPFARLAHRVNVVGSKAELAAALTSEVDPDVVWTEAGDRFAAARLTPSASTPDLARSATQSGLDREADAVLAWDGRAALVRHAGACALVIARLHAEGWSVRVDGEPAALGRVDGGLQCVEISGNGVARVDFAYQPWGFRVGLIVSMLATILLAVVIFVGSRKVEPGRVLSNVRRRFTRLGPRG
ncbi:MAG: hypothetical protein KGM43_10080, partial [Planctomycetota bacterium]|nr:hypothetical protein [Planctomycetota bacterium]